MSYHADPEPSTFQSVIGDAQSGASQDEGIPHVKLCPRVNGLVKSRMKLVTGLESSLYQAIRLKLAILYLTIRKMYTFQFWTCICGVPLYSKLEFIAVPLCFDNLSRQADKMQEWTNH